jgi:hypothetical protein
MDANGCRGKRYRSLIIGLPRKSSVCHRGSVVHAHADHDEHRIVLLRAALDRRHYTPLAQRGTPSASREPASTTNPPPQGYSAWAGQFLYGHRE